MGRGAHRPRALAEDACGGRSVQADDHPQQYGLGLVAGQPGDQFQGALGAEGLQRLVVGAVVAGQFQGLVLERGGPGTYFLAPQMVERAVPGDGRGPAAEPGAVPRNRPRSRAISSQASDATSSASSPTIPRR